MQIFGPPNIEKLKASQDVNGLIKALSYKQQSYRYNHARIRQEAALALGEIGDARAVQPILDLLKHRYTSEFNSAIIALGKIGDARAVDPLILILKDRDKQVRKLSAEALGRIGDYRAVDALTEALNDSSNNVCVTALHALGRIRDARAVHVLIAALLHFNYSVRKAAPDILDSLGWKPETDEDKARYWVSRQDRDECLALGEKALDALSHAFRIQGDQSFRCWALVTLGQVKNDLAVQYLFAALADYDKVVHRTAAEILIRLYKQGKLNDEQKIQLLTQKERITKHHNDQIRHSDRAAQTRHYDTICFDGHHEDSRPHLHEDNPNAHNHVYESTGIDFPL